MKSPPNATTSPPRDDDSDAALSAACDKGDAARCYALGKRYGDYGSPRYDPARAVALYRRGCDAHGDRACLSLAVAMQMGQAIPRDLAGALALTERLCTKGYADACTNLGDVPQRERRPARLVAWRCPRAQGLREGR